MKPFYLTLKILFLFTAILGMSLDSGCKNPEEYKPPEDSLIPPPAPPQLIIPNDSAFFSMTPGSNIDIYFEWSNITDADFYEIEFSDNPTFTNSTRYKYYTHSATINFTELGKYFWHVRAYSPLWTWYTNWSETRYFLISSLF